MKKKIHKVLRGNSSQFFVAGELCRRGLVAVVTMGNCPNTDILCSNLGGTRFAHIQVKTFAPGNKTCSVGMKAESDYGESFFWILSGIPSAESDLPFEYYIIPAGDMAKNVREGFELWKNTPGIRVEKHDPDNTVRAIQLPPLKCKTGWCLDRYLNRWDTIVSYLAE